MEKEYEGSSVAEAVDNALKALGLRRDQVEVQIIREACAGFMGIGKRTAKVKVVEKRWSPERPQHDVRITGSPYADTGRPRGQHGGGHGRSGGRHGQGDRHGNRQQGGNRDRRRDNAADQRPEPMGHYPRPQRQSRPPQGERRAAAERSPEPAIPLEPAETAAACAVSVEIIKKLLSLMKFEGGAKAAWDATQERVMAVIETPDASHLIGKDGHTLDAMQFLVTVMTTREIKKPVAVWTDCLGYLARREEAVLREAKKGADIVKRTKKPFRLSPMDAAMRRLVHRTLAGETDITTVSEGEGQWRKIVIRPRGG